MADKSKEVYYELGFSSHKGNMKDLNEDNYCAVHEEDDEKGSRALIAVSDGVGGFSLGEIASKITTNGVEKFFRMGEFDQMFRESEFLEPPRVIQELYTRINHKIRSLMEKENRAVGCTLVSGFFHDDEAYIANIGNSRAFLLRDGSITQLTEEKGETVVKPDMSSIGDGSISGAKGGAYVNSLGSDISLKADINHFSAKDGDILIFCSDGLYTQVDDHEIIDAAAQTPTMQKLATTLIDKANEAGGEDNVTVVTVRVNIEKGSYMGALGKRFDVSRMQPHIIIGGAVLLLIIMAGIIFLMGRFLFKPPKPKPTNKRLPRHGGYGVYNTLTMEAEVPISFLKINRRKMPFKNNYQTYDLEEDVNEIRILPNMSKYRPALYKVTITGSRRDLRVIQDRRNKLLIKPERITLSLTRGSSMDYLIKEDRTGDKFVLTVDNLGSPYYIIMEAQDNLHVLVKTDPRAKKVTKTVRTAPTIVPPPTPTATSSPGKM